MIVDDQGEPLRFGPLPSTKAHVPYYHHKNGSFRRELLPGPAP